MAESAAEIKSWSAEEVNHAVRVLLDVTDDELILAQNVQAGVYLVPAVLDENSSEQVASGELPVGTIEYQVSDGPPGHRSSSQDFYSFEKAFDFYLHVVMQGWQKALKQEQNDE